MNLSTRSHLSRLAAIVLAVSLVVSACTSIRLISAYDQQTDEALTALHDSTDEFIAKLIANAKTSKNAFNKHKNFYDETDMQLRRLEFRVGSIPDNRQTVKLVADIRASILGEGKCTADGGSLRDLHCLPENAAKGPSKVALEISRRNVNQTIRAALALELAKKQGLEPKN
ncbi:MAG: hypothetical protein P8X96_08385 [Desulfobacteraceae bacterium]|jgi:hypothetical protein